VVTVDAFLKVPVEESVLGWRYKGAPLKVGAPISFETTTYTVDGGVTDVTVTDEDRHSPLSDAAPR
jgi:hypothetical protein